MKPILSPTANFCFALVVLTGCNSPRSGVEADASPTPVEESAPPLSPTEPIALGGYVQDARLAFRKTGGSWTAKHLRYDANIKRGVVTMSPRHTPDGNAIVGKAMGLETIYVGRTGGETLGLGFKATKGNGSKLHILRQGVEERFQNRDNGLEQTWHFDKKPEGEGELTVRISVTGLNYRGVSKNGLHFADETGMGFRYGRATWVDGNGNKTRAPMQYLAERSEIAIYVPSTVLDSSAYPAVLDPIITPEIEINTPTIGWSGAQAREGAVAFGGGQYLAVWEDRRATDVADIYATRITPDGVTLDPTGIVVSQASEVQTAPTVAYDGSRFLVVWSDDRNSGTAPDLYGARISPDGSVNPLASPISATAGAEGDPRVASNGNGASLVVWEQDDDVRGVVVNVAAVGSAFDVAATGAVEANPNVGANPAGDFLVAWEEGASAHDIRGTRVTTGGSPVGAFDISAASGSQKNVSVDFNGTDYFAVWNTGGNIAAARVSTADVVLDTTDQSGSPVGGVVVVNAPDTQSKPDVSCSTNCLIAWQDRRNKLTTGDDVYGLEMSPSFAAVGSEVVLSAADSAQQKASVAAGSGAYMVVWEDARTGGAKATFGNRVNSGGGAQDGDGFLLSTGTDRERGTAVSYMGGKWYVAWGDSATVGTDIVGSRIRDNGLVDDDPAITVSSADGNQSRPALAFTGPRSMMAWRDARNDDDDIYISSVRTNGTPLNPSGIPLSTGPGNQLAPAVASDGTNALVVWQDRRNGDYDIYAALVTAAGAVISNDIVVCATTGNQEVPAVEYDSVNDMYLVVWSDARVSETERDIYAARVDSAGAVLDGSCGTAVSSASSIQRFPDLRFDGTQFLVVWEDLRDFGTTAVDLYASRVALTPAISVTDPAGLLVSDAAADQEQPAVEVANGGFVIVWQDSREFAIRGTDIYGARLNASGAVVEEFGISRDADSELEPDVQVNSSGDLLVVYQRFRSDLDADRAEARRVSVGADLGTACSQDSQCGSGFCVDNRCCDSACGGGDTTDCQACAINKGGSVEGVCGPRRPGQRCRLAVDVCDRIERCDGVSLDCPPDIPEPPTKICRRAVDDFTCDLNDRCDGVNNFCPEDLGQNEGVVCDPACGAVCPANDGSGAPHECPPC